MQITLPGRIKYEYCFGPKGLIGNTHNFIDNIILYEGSKFDINDKKKRLGINNKQKIALIFNYDSKCCIDDRNEL